MYGTTTSVPIHTMDGKHHLNPGTPSVFFERSVTKKLVQYNIQGRQHHPFHEIVPLQECIGDFIIIIPIDKDGDERLRGRVACEIIAARHPQICGIVSVGSPTVRFTEVLRLVVDLPVPTISAGRPAPARYPPTPYRNS